jgi:cytochrome bd-type quinol oxidase subunit 1
MKQLRQALAALLSLASAAAAGAVGDFAATRLRGVNRSDVGVVMWSHGGRAVAGGLFAFVITAALLLWAVRRALGRDDRWPSLVGAAASLLVLAVLSVGWLVTYG